MTLRNGDTLRLMSGSYALTQKVLQTVGRHRGRRPLPVHPFARGQSSMLRLPASAHPVRRSATCSLLPSIPRLIWWPSPTSTSRGSSRCRTLPQDPRLPGLARAARGRQGRELGERLDAGPHAPPGRVRSDEEREGGLRSEAALQHAAGNTTARRICSPKDLQDADRHPGILEPLAAFRRSAALRSGIVGKIREVHTFSNKGSEMAEPLPARAIQCRPRSTGMSGSASAPTCFEGVFTGAMAAGIGFRIGTLGDIGCRPVRPIARSS